MPRYAILCGSAPEGFTQKKLLDMCDFLVSEEGGSWAQSGILTFPNGVSEKMLEYVLGNLGANASSRREKVHVLLYMCTETSVADYELSVWLGGEEIRKSVIASAAKQYIDIQIIYDSDREFVADEAMEICSS